MADEGELAFAMTLRDEATSEARAARAQLEAVTGETRPIETPVRAKDETGAGLSSASRNLDAFGRKAQRIGRTMTTHLTLPIVGVGAAAVGLEATYDRTMRQVTIATGGPSDALDALAKKLGAETQFSAGEAADAMLELAKGGMTAATIQGGALEQTMTLAAAGGIDLASAATYVSNGLAVYGLNAKDAGRVTVALAGAANASSASVESLGQGMSQAALSAKATGLSIEETAGALSLFDAMGLKGADAGTSFKTMLNGLLPTTTKQKNAMNDLGLSFVDSEGNFDDLGTVAAKLHDKLGPLTEAQRRQALTTIFGTDAFRAANILTEGGRKAVEKYTTAAKDQKTTQELANAAMEGTSGALERAKGSAETAGLAFGEVLAPYVEDAAGAIESASNWLAELDPNTQKAVVGIGAVAAAAGPLIMGIGGISRGVSSTIDLLARFRPAVDTTTSSTDRLSRSSATAGTNVSKLGRYAKVAAGVGGLAAIAGSAMSADEGTSQLLGTLGGAATGFAIGGPVGAAVGALGGYVTASSSAKDSQQQLADAQQRVIDTLNAQTGAFTKRTRAQFLSDAGDQGLLESARALNINIATLTDTAMKGDHALGQMQAAALAAAPEESRAGIVDLFTAISTMSDELFAGQKGWLLEAEGMRKGGAAARAAREDVNTLVGTYGLVPRQARTVVEAVNAGKSRAEIAKILNQFDVFPTRKRAILELIGAGKLRSEAKGATAALEGVGKVKPKTDTWLRALLGDMGAGEKIARRGGVDVQKGLEDAPGKARVNLQGWRQGLLGAITGTEAPARTAGTQVGNAITSGAMGAIRPLAAQAAAEAGRAYRAAIAAARGGGGGGGGGGGNSRQERGASTSDRISARGKDGGKGGRDDAAAFGQELIDALVAGFEGGLDKLDEVLDRTHSQIEAFYKRDLNQRERAIREAFKGQKDADRKIAKAIAEAEQQTNKRRKAALQALRQESAAIREQAKIREGLAAQLAAAYAEIDPAKFRAMGEEFRNGLRSFAALTTFQPTNDAPITAAFLQQHLDAQLAKVQGFAGNLAALRGKVSDTILRQLEEAGAENGAAYAQALAASTPQQLAAINATQAAIDAATEAAGVDMAGHWQEIAVNASAGLIAGLEGQIAAIDEVGRKLARTLRRAILNHLGIKSPSKVLRADMRVGVGGGVIAGITDSIPGVEAAAADLAGRVASSAQVDANVLAAAVNASPGVSAVTRTEIVTIRHEVTSPDGSLDELTASQVADLIARDPRSAQTLERALRRARGRQNRDTVTATDSTL